jgi:hypothetical protein
VQQLTTKRNKIMAYISTQAVKEIREELKSLFPAKKGWKLSVTKSDSNYLNVAIMEAPIEIRNNPALDNENINPYYILDRENKLGADLIYMMYEIANRNNFDKSDLMSDYFHVGYYFGMSIGTWNKPFKLNV